MEHTTKSLLGPEVDLKARRERLRDVWQALESSESSGATTWDVFEDFRQKVTDCLIRGKPDDISQAERLTAEFLCRFRGMKNT